MSNLSSIGSITVVKGLCAFAVACFASVGYSFTDSAPAMSLEQITKSADEVVIGNVLASETRIVGNSFETDYKIQIHENLKSRSGGPQQGDSFTLTLPGGSIPEPPLTQYAMGAPYMYKGEEVCLFLKKGSGKQSTHPAAQTRSAAPPSNLTNSYKVVGWNQGRFSVVTREDTGEKVVTRVNMENYGVTNGSNEMQEVMKAVAKRQVPTVESNVARMQDIADEARMKDPLEVTSADGKKIKIERSAQKADILKAMRDRQALAVQKYSDFKAQVQGFAADGN